ncbi:MAG: adenylate/guanylate cyclase domain-containing protein, partial [Gammaproteobacteria bacterium]|nr:adenylate/guanylate cyclase domain-containing protein [Gammaproteobacteria bacterium]
GAVATSTLSRYLKSLTQRGSPVAFILTGRDRVLAYPGMADGLPVPTKADGAALPLITDIDDAVLAALWSDDRRELSALAELRQSRGHWTWVAGSSFGYFYRTLRGYGDEPWTVGIYLPGVETRRERWLVRGIAIGGALLLGVAASLAMLIGRRLGRPVLQLASIAERIERLDFESARDLPRGPIKEVNQAICAFERTAVGLSLFQSYVPRPVARLLLERHGNLQPEEMTGTVLFVDIVGFTSLAEALPPRQVVALLNEYFTAMSEIISANNGVITQFQGDAVLATFNIPLRLSGHATAAVRSALQILSMVSQRLFSGQSVHVRIGINTGRLTGGSVGAAGRLSYTVHGDAVNLAARLEQMNKEYGTVMLVSESTVALIGTLDCLRRIGPVNVRGRSRPVDIYALVPTPDLRSALHQTDCIVAAS